MKYDDRCPCCNGKVKFNLLMDNGEVIKKVGKYLDGNFVYEDIGTQNDWIVTVNKVNFNGFFCEYCGWKQETKKYAI